MREIEKARAQAFMDAVDVVHKYFQMELDRLQTDGNGEIKIDVEQLSRINCILRYNSDICTALNWKAYYGAKNGN